MDYNFTYNFPAVRGIQANREYYVAMCPLKLIPKIFLFDEEEIPAEFRAQRLLNKHRIPEITRYILENPNDYVFSSITASVDGEMHFIPFDETTNKNIGKLVINMDARFLINDGQHRRAAIEEAISINPDLGNETISVVFFHDQGLKRSQQLFADLNKHAVNSTKSIGILYDWRDELSIITKEIIQSNDLLRTLTDMENSSLSKFSPKIFTLSAIYSTNKRLVNLKKGSTISEETKEFLKQFWITLTSSIQEWNLVLNKQITAHELRTNYLCSYGITLEAIGMIGYELYISNKKDWINILKKLGKIDWSRSNTSLWLHRAYNRNGRINKNQQSIKLTKNQIKLQLGLPLTEEEQQLEQEFLTKEFQKWR
ncbi:DNA sulfur modification protein DndB [Thermolongibacillus altinsuensis]|uniref:DNA sulfur modification protein DndB n=1 Tax=Thermolongibacillus altinsuensis TaxID=575256 RepID=A0A4R1QM15_9BACL|nr:DNA sulfur modification protein DndB [Thermolongibacillus altinsuensis]TCL53255.1 DNA sulfur modification protein DndB [Thermolongibacillus altinsuensis]